MYIPQRSSRSQKKLIVGIVTTIFILFLAAVVVFALTRKQEGQLKVLSIPNATVFVENAPKQQTPYEENMKPGTYLIKLIPNGQATAAAAWQQQVTVYKNAQTYINRLLGPTDAESSGEVLSILRMEKRPAKSGTGELYIDSDPTGALIYLDNDEQGVAPNVLQLVPEGEHEIGVYLPGFIRRNIRVNVVAGYRIQVQVKIAVDKNNPIATQAASLSPSTTLTEISGTPTSSPSVSVTPVVSPTPALVVPQGGFIVKILDTPTGFLRVREDSTVNAKEVGRLKPGDRVVATESSQGWYKVELSTGVVGWISAQYARKQ